MVAGVCTYPVYRVRQLTFPQRASAVICLGAPILFINAISSVFYPQMYPNLPASLEGLYSSIFLLYYALGLLTAFLPLGTRLVVVRQHEEHYG